MINSFSFSDRRRGVARITLAAVAVAFVSLTGWRVYLAYNPLINQPPPPLRLRAAATANCDVPIAPAHAAGFIDAYINGLHQQSVSTPFFATTRGGDVGLVGWALLPALRLPTVVVARIDGVCLPATFRPRPDVAAVYKDRKLTYSGYILVIPAGMLTKGTHQIKVYAIDAAAHRRMQVGPILVVERR